jgi:hypothetical protein
MKFLPLIFLAVLAATSSLHAQWPILGASDVKPGVITRSEFFDGKALVGYINGGAEIYFEYGFKRLTVQDVTIAGHDLRIETYQMSDPGAAFGIYSVSAEGCENEDPLIPYSCVSQYQVQGVSGSICFRIQNPTGSPDLHPTMIAYARMIAQRTSEAQFEMPSLFRHPRFASSHSSVRRICGPLAMQNSRPGWCEYFGVVDGYAAYLMECDGSYTNPTLALVKFRSEETGQRFLQSLGIAASNPAGAIARIDRDTIFVWASRASEVTILDLPPRHADVRELIEFLNQQSKAADDPASGSPVERHDFGRVTTHQELMDEVKRVAGQSSTMELQIIGKTVRGRDIPAFLISRSGSFGDAAKLRVMVFAQQHGNEPSGKEAALMLLDRIRAGELNALLDHLDLLLVPCVNPDGNELVQRYNAAGADLNRSHILLHQPETAALHILFNRWEPEATLDVHEFQALGDAWTTRGFVRAIDEQLGAPTNLNISPALRAMIVDRLFPFVASRLKEAGFRFFNYSIVDSPEDTLRHSTTDINDGRQSLAILNTFSCILEGRNARDFNGDLERRSRGQLAAIMAYLQYCADHADEIKRVVHAERDSLSISTAPVKLQMSHVHGGEHIAVPVKTYPGGKDSTVSLLYAPNIVSWREVPRPAAYIIPRQEKDILSVLQRHGITMHAIDKRQEMRVESYSVVKVDTSGIEGDPVLVPRVTKAKGMHTFEAGDVVVLMNQLHSTMIALTLEPESQWGLVQYKPFERLRNLDTEYPVYRLVAP